jgi:replication factor C subunit 1
MSASTTSNKTEIRLHYLTMLKELLIKPLILRGTDSIEEVISLMDAYGITKDDFEAIAELAELTNADMYSKVPSNVKAAFTRTYSHLIIVIHL